MHARHGAHRRYGRSLPWDFHRISVPARAQDETL